MIGNVIAPFEGVYIEPFDPDNVFDPTTHIATEENFIQLLEHGIYDSKYIGYKVTLTNSAQYNNGTWIIADVNHDSSNTGQTNCYDLISVDCINPGISFGSSQNWRDSNMRTWLNGTFYNGLSSDIKSRIMNIKYNSQGTWYNDDKIIIPSCTELNYSNTYAAVEGIRYPIFTDSTSRVKKQFGTTNTYYWWTRSRYTANINIVWDVLTDGTLYSDGYYISLYVVPTLRVS